MAVHVEKYRSTVLASWVEVPSVNAAMIVWAFSLAQDAPNESVSVSLSKSNEPLKVLGNFVDRFGLRVSAVDRKATINFQKRID